MAVLNQDYEEGTNGTTITIANSAGTGENAVDTAVTGTGNTQKYDTTTHLTSGSVSLKHTVVSTSNGNCYWAWTTSLGTLTQYYIRGYFKLDTAVGVRLFMGMNGSTTTWSIKISSTQHIQITSGITTQATGTLTIPLNTVFRIEAFIDHTNGMLTCKIYLGGNSEGSTPDETLTFPSAQTFNGQANDAGLRVGAQDIANFTLWTDAIKMSTTGYVGAANPPAATTLSGMSVAATSTVSGKVATKHKVSGAVSAISTVGGTIFKAGTATVPSTYGVGVFGQAVYGGSGAPPPTGIVGSVNARATVSGGVSRLSSSGSGGGVYTPPYTPPNPPPTPPPGTFDTFAQAVYDDLLVDTLHT